MKTSDDLAPITSALPADLNSGSLMTLRMWWSGSVLRLAGVWLLLAGMLAAGGAAVTEIPLMQVVLAVFLADAIWGALWEQTAGGGTGQLASDGSASLRLPYANDAGIAGHSGWLAAAIRSALPLAILALLLAALIGAAALWLTGLVLSLAAGGWLLQRVGQLGVGRWLHALACAATPFALGVLVTPLQHDWPQAGWLIGLGAGLTLLYRAALGQADEEEHVLWIAGCGSALIVAVLVLAQLPVAAALTALLAVAPLWLLARPGGARLGIVHAWWWLLAVAAAASLGLGIG